MALNRFIVRYFFITLSVISSQIAFADPAHIPDVVVTAPQQSTGDLANLANASVITQQQIRNSGADDIVDLLNGQPGVRVYTSSGDPQRASISLRGFGSNATQNTLILIDGRRLINPDLAAADLSTLSLAQVKRIEILPGSAGVLYGDQAVGGVVNIITQQANSVSQTAQLQVGSYDTANAYANAALAYDNGFNMQIDGDKRITDNYREHNELNSGGARLRLGYRYDNGSAFLQGQYHQHDINLPGSLTSAQIIVNRRAADPDSLNNFADDKTGIITTGVEHWLNSHWQIQTDLSQRFMSSSSTYGTINTPQLRQTTQVNPLIIAHYPLFQRSLVSRFGTNVSYDTYRLEATPFGNTDYSIRDNQFMQSIYTQWQIPIGQRLQLIAGARGAWLQGKLNGSRFNNNAWVSELDLHYQFNSALLGYIRRSGNYRFPKADEQNNTDSLASSRVTPLKTQTGVSYEAGLQLQQSRYRVKAGLYQLNLRNEIAYMPPDNTPHGLAVNRNIDPTQRRGILLDGDVKIIQPLTLLGSYTYTDARYRHGDFAGNRIPLVPRNMGRLAVNYQFLTRWHLLTEAIFTGDMYAWNDNTNLYPIAHYVVYNAALHYHYQQLQLTGRVDNITAKKYNNYVAYWGNDLHYYPAATRHFVLTLGFQFP